MAEKILKVLCHNLISNPHCYSAILPYFWQKKYKQILIETILTIPKLVMQAEWQIIRRCTHRNLL